MDVASELSCPWCGETLTLQIDTGVRFQQFTTDCEVCCRPIAVKAECDPGEILGLDAQPG